MNFHIMMRRNFLRFAICLNLGCVFVPFLFAQTKIVLDLQRTIEFIAVRLNSTTIKIVCSTADFPRSSIFFSFPSPP